MQVLSRVNQFGSRVSIQSRLVGGFVVILLLFGLVSGLALLRNVGYQNDLERVRQFDDVIGDVRAISGEVRSQTQFFGSNNPPSNQPPPPDGSLPPFSSQIDLATVQQEIAVIRKDLTNTTILSADEHNQVTAIFRQYDQVVNLVNQNAEALKNPSPGELNTFRQQANPLVNGLTRDANRLYDQLQNRANNNIGGALDSANKAQWGIIGGGLFGILLGIIIAVTTTGWIVRQNRRLETTLTQLRGVNLNIAKRQEAGQQMSSEVLSLATELNSTATQQDSGSRNQVSVVSQIGASLHQLSETAGQITTLAQQVSTATNQVAQDAGLIENTAVQSVEQSQIGLQAVKQSIQVSEALAQVYGHLLERMDELSSRSSNMRMILSVIGSVAQETHLLALNAAIEAAGAGNYGERFAVVAREIKGLANRSADASKDVVELVAQIERATNLTVTEAQDGYNKALEMAVATNHTGTIISSMRHTIETSYSQATSINRASQEVRNLNDIIKTATLQQRTATQQVLQALNDLRVVAEQSAEGTDLISRVAFNLEELSQNLTHTLAA